MPLPDNQYVPILLQTCTLILEVSSKIFSRQVIKLPSNGILFSPRGTYLKIIIIIFIKQTIEYKLFYTQQWVDPTH